VIAELGGWLVGRCARNAALVVALVAVLFAIAVAVVATRLGINTSTEEMIDAEVPFRQREIDFDRAFPQFDDVLVIVLDAATPEAAEAGAAELAERLAARPDLVRSVRRPDAHPYFRSHGVLFLPEAEVAAIADRIIEAQPMLGALAADPSLRGLFAVLNLALDAVVVGEADAADLVARFAPFATAIEGVLAGREQPMAWSSLLGEAPADPRGPRRLILVQPVLDEGSLAPGATASRFVRAAAAELGLAVRLTGSVALDDEELASVARGSEWGLALSLLLVAGLLWLAVREAKLVVANLATLVVGLVLTTAFAALAVGTLNLISVAFGILFVGIAVDFGIQFAVRFRAERSAATEVRAALARTGRAMGHAMTLAGAATAAGFLAFLPTEFDGVAELGLISAAGMVIALALGLTLLPALIALLRPAGSADGPGFARLAALDAALAIHHRAVLATLGLLGIAALAALAWLRFDVNPLHLKDTESESVATLDDLLADPTLSPYALDVIAPDSAAAAALAARLRALPGVARAVTLADFVPPDQEAKLAILADAAMILGPTLAPPSIPPPPQPEDVLAAMAKAAERLLALPETEEGSDIRRLANALDAAVDRGPALVPALELNLIGGLPALLEDLGGILTLGPVSAETLPEDLARDWRAPDGRTRVAVYPEGRDLDDEGIAAFVASVRGAAPEATGMAASIVDSGRVVVGAFVTATLLALAAIVALLALALRRARDVALVLAPLLLAGLLTLATSVVLGLPINFANIIGLPLLLGIGVSFPTYLVIGRRQGAEGFLQTGTARAVLFSAATTGAAFGSLALSGHPGTAAMGTLLLIAIAALLVCNLLGLPALLAAVER
jgi:hypothetical protein